MVKKILPLLLICSLLLFSGTFCACTKQEQTKSDHISVVVTLFPFYDWVQEIIGDKSDGIDVSLLVKNGTDLHSYQPSMADIVSISTCDLFIYTGGESDAWVDDVLSSAKNKDMRVINLIDLLGDNAKTEEMVEGMEKENHSHDEDSEAEYDEHVWLSLKNAVMFCQAIAEQLDALCLNANSTTDGNFYHTQAEAYIKKLRDLDEKYQQTVDEADTDTLLFGDRFPFRYLTHDYGLRYYAAFSGCSAETEASFDTIAFLAKKMDELNLTHCMVTESSNHSIAQTIIQNTKEKDQDILMLDSLQSVLYSEIEQGVSYLAIMEKNLDTLKTALH
ncbi:MAG: zinc ABC transporter substrate-binding protein [Clostridiales bacterium]|nr:zinc ABC transporter substrate-binding protein [Clostridiales bacterium]